MSSNLLRDKNMLLRPGYKGGASSPIYTGTGLGLGLIGARIGKNWVKDNMTKELKPYKEVLAKHFPKAKTPISIAAALGVYGVGGLLGSKMGNTVGSFFNNTTIHPVSDLMDSN